MRADASSDTGGQTETLQFPWRVFLFYVAVPAVFASYAASGHQLNAYLPAWQVLAYSLTHALIAWWVVCGVTRGLQELLRRWRPHQLILLSIGVVLTQVVYAPVTGLLDQAFLSILADTPDISAITAALHPSSDSTPIHPAPIRDYLIWIAVNLFFDRFLGLPRYRYTQLANPAAEVTNASSDDVPGFEAEQVNAQEVSQPASIETPASTAFAFLSRMENPPNPDDVIALKAEQHYLNVITRERSHIVLYRFGDAVDAIPQSLGVQVHRSWWIRKDALKYVHQSGRKMLAELDTGQRVPVSGPNQALLRRVAAERDARIKPLRGDWSTA